MTTTKRGINLGCGTLIMPCEKPDHHYLLPDELYTTDILWDNVDHNGLPGVNMVVDLFDYPWVVKGDNGRVPLPQMVPTNTYDVALAAHLIEHIPHGIMRGGKVVSTHGGWWAWWREMGRVLKPGGVVYALMPYGWAHSGVTDPTHTRQIMTGTFGYFNPDEDAPFVYDIGFRWEAVYGPLLGFTEEAVKMAQPFLKYGWTQDQALEYLSLLHLNIVREFALGLEVQKDGTEGQLQSVDAGNPRGHAETTPGLAQGA